MISRLSVCLPVAILGAMLLAPPAPAQGRGGRGAGAGARMRSSFGFNGREGFARPAQRQFLNYPYLFPPYFYPYDDFDYGPGAPEPGAVQPIIVMQPAQPPAPPAPPAESLLLESHGGQWVRVPTGSQMAIPQSAKPDAAQTSSTQSEIAEPAVAAPPLPELPPAIVVFRDGHMEELGKYMIQGVVLFTTADYWSTGSWTRKIPLAELDIPASLKLNKERGSKFNLPSGPNEVVVRF